MLRHFSVIRDKHSGSVWVYMNNLLTGCQKYHLIKADTVPQCTSVYNGRHCATVHITLQRQTLCHIVDITLPRQKLCQTKHITSPRLTLCHIVHITLPRQTQCHSAHHITTADSVPQCTSPYHGRLSATVHITLPRQTQCHSAHHLTTADSVPHSGHHLT